MRIFLCAQANVILSRRDIRKKQSLSYATAIPRTAVVIKFRDASRRGTTRWSNNSGSKKRST